MREFENALEFEVAKSKESASRNQSTMFEKEALQADSGRRNVSEALNTQDADVQHKSTDDDVDNCDVQHDVDLLSSAKKESSTTRSSARDDISCGFHVESQRLKVENKADGHPEMPPAPFQALDFRKVQKMLRQRGRLSKVLAVFVATTNPPTDSHEITTWLTKPDAWLNTVNDALATSSSFSSSSSDEKGGSFLAIEFPDNFDSEKTTFDLNHVTSTSFLSGSDLGSKRKNTDLRPRAFDTSFPAGSSTSSTSTYTSFLRGANSNTKTARRAGQEASADVSDSKLVAWLRASRRGSFVETKAVDSSAVHKTDDNAGNNADDRGDAGAIPRVGEISSVDRLVKDVADGDSATRRSLARKSRERFQRDDSMLERLQSGESMTSTIDQAAQVAAVHIRDAVRRASIRLTKRRIKEDLQEEAKFPPKASREESISSFIDSKKRDRDGSRGSDAFEESDARGIAPGVLTATQKVVHFIRHGQGTHNVASKTVSRPVSSVNYHFTQRNHGISNNVNHVDLAKALGNSVKDAATIKHTTNGKDAYTMNDEDTTSGNYPKTKANVNTNQISNKAKTTDSKNSCCDNESKPLTKDTSARRSNRELSYDGMTNHASIAYHKKENQDHKEDKEDKDQENSDTFHTDMEKDSMTTGPAEGLVVKPHVTTAGADGVGPNAATGDAGGNGTASGGENGTATGAAATDSITLAQKPGGISPDIHHKELGENGAGGKGAPKTVEHTPDPRSYRPENDPRSDPLARPEEDPPYFTDKEGNALPAHQQAAMTNLFRTSSHPRQNLFENGHHGAKYHGQQKGGGEKEIDHDSNPHLDPHLTSLGEAEAVRLQLPLKAAQEGLGPIKIAFVSSLTRTTETALIATRKLKRGKNTINTGIDRRTLTYVTSEEGLQFCRDGNAKDLIDGNPEEDWFSSGDAAVARVLMNKKFNNQNDGFERPHLISTDLLHERAGRAHCDKRKSRQTLLWNFNDSPEAWERKDRDGEGKGAETRGERMHQQMKEWKDTDAAASVVTDAGAHAATGHLRHHPSGDVGKPAVLVSGESWYETFARRSQARAQAIPGKVETTPGSRAETTLGRNNSFLQFGRQGSGYDEGGVSGDGDRNDSCSGGQKTIGGPQVQEQHQSTVTTRLNQGTTGNDGDNESADSQITLSNTPAKFLDVEIDYGLVKSERDPYWVEGQRETLAHMTRRGIEFVELLATTPEKHIVVVTHAAFSWMFFNSILSFEPTEDNFPRFEQSKMMTGEMRTLILDFKEPPSSRER